MAEEQSRIADWVNLPAGISDESLWEGLHEAQIISMQSNLLERTVTLHVEIENLRIFHQWPLDMHFVFRLEGVQSARAVKYSIWPGTFAVPSGVSKEEQERLVAEYQAKWREESANWSDLEKAVTAEHKEVIDIVDASLAAEKDGSVALRISGLLNYTAYHEVFLRAEKLTISRTDAGEVSVEELLKLGAAYWDALEQHEREDVETAGRGGEGENKS
jgi:uncharacterized protein YbdZ (MbtH family)